MKKSENTPKRITTRADLVTLARDLGVRPDWHEPDEQEVTATTEGVSFDNAGFWPKSSESSDYPYHPSIIEMSVTLSKGGKPVAVVNLATLFAWAAGLED